MIALYALAIFVPLTLQLLAEHARTAALWRLIAILAVAYFYFGWQHGASVAGDYFTLSVLLGILWLMALPFAQSRLTQGRWSVQYHALFTDAWRNKLVLAEAGLFTGLFWLLLFLWQMLFHMLGIDFFRELFDEPIFVYPVTSLAFGCALHLIGSIERLTSLALEQLLNVLKWLGLVAGVILACFTVELALKLPGLVFTGQKAIGAAWLLWLAAVVVLLLNAAYRDGSVPQPYPRWAAQFLRAVVPLTVIVSSTALYALTMRSRLYGLSVERVWAFVVAGAAWFYSVGYSISAFRAGAWLGGIARVNVIVALALIAVIAAALTPVISPYRLAANSQFRQVQEKGLAANDQHSPLHYLRFDSGRYGRVRLQELAERKTGAGADDIAAMAKRLLLQQNPWEATPPSDVGPAFSKLRIYPAGRTLDTELNAKLNADIRDPRNGFTDRIPLDSAAGIFIDLNHDHSDEFVFLSGNRGLVYENREGRWALVGDTYAVSTVPAKRNFDAVRELGEGNASAIPPAWDELAVGSYRFKVNVR